MSDSGIGFPVIMSIRMIIGIPQRVVIPSVRFVIYQTETHSRPNKVAVIRPVYEMPVVHVHITGIVCKQPSGVIVNIHTSYSVNPTIAIVD